MRSSRVAGKPQLNLVICVTTDDNQKIYFPFCRARFTHNRFSVVTILANTAQVLNTVKVYTHTIHFQKTREKEKRRKEKTDLIYLLFCFSLDDENIKKREIHDEKVARNRERKKESEREKKERKSVYCVFFFSYLIKCYRCCFIITHITQNTTQ